MCKCAPDQRIPYCGKPNCEWPERPSPTELRINSEIILERPGILDTMCQHIAAGGSIVELADMWHASYWVLVQWMGADPDRKKTYDSARSAHSEWCEDMVMRELKKIAFVDVRQAYDKEGNLLAMKDMPDAVAASIVSVDVFEEKEWNADTKSKDFVGYTKKIKFNNKLEALKMLGDTRGLWRKADIANAARSLEDIISESWGPRNKEDNKSV